MENATVQVEDLQMSHPSLKKVLRTINGVLLMADLSENDYVVVEEIAQDVFIFARDKLLSKRDAETLIEKLHELECSPLKKIWYRFSTVLDEKLFAHVNALPQGRVTSITRHKCYLDRSPNESKRRGSPRKRALRACRQGMLTALLMPNPKREAQQETNAAPS